VMNDVELKEDLPESYREKAARLGIYDRELRGRSGPPAYAGQEEIRREAGRVVEYIKKVVFPKVSV